MRSQRETASALLLGFPIADISGLQSGGVAIWTAVMVNGSETLSVVPREKAVTFISPLDTVLEMTV